LLEANLITDADALARLRDEWDELALACELPLMAPAWLLAWWRNIAVEGSLLRVLELREGGRLVGLAPFHVPPSRSRVDYRLLGIGVGAPLAPLSQPGREGEVARAIGRALSRARPRPDLVVLQGVPLAAGWHDALVDVWPGRIKPISNVYRTRAFPTIELGGGSLEGWLSGRSSKFRSAMRRLARRFEDEGGSWRISTEATLERDVETFERLHAARWQGRGQSTVVAYGGRMRAMLIDAARALIADQRFRLWVMEIEGEAVAADIYISGGGIAVGINGGWDERFKRLSPPLLATMHTVEDCIFRGERRVEMGPGGESHKTRFADADNPVVWSVLMAPGRRLARTLALTAPMLTGNAAGKLAKRVLTPEQVDALRTLRGVAGGPTRTRVRGSLPRA
jgi:CelD/BcsL family acetyltransferase involved in cellulose biosynthesis